ncbi:MAG: hypothetical protein AB8B77_04725 [Alphaproteobacteria bacterium]
MMTYNEIIEGFDQLDKEVVQFLNGEENVEGDPPLHDLSPRLNDLCAAVLKLPVEEMPEPRVRMTQLQNTLKEVSALMQRLADEHLAREEAEEAAEESKSLKN